MFGRRSGLVLLALALMIGTVATGLARNTLRERYVLAGTNIYPEGIAYQPTNGDFFVSSTSDGTIYRGNIGRGAATAFLKGGADGRTATTGLKVDSAGRLYVSGGATGKMFVYDTNTRKLLAAFDNNLDTTFINDVTLGPDGTAYFTDSQNPVIYTIARAGDDFTFGSFALTAPFVYRQGFNANGIATTPDGQYLIVVQSNTGKLFRINIATKAITEVNLGGASVAAGDGILFVGQTLYVVRNQLALIVPVQLNADYSSGAVGEGFTSEWFQYPTTIANVENSLLVVNSQFDRRNSGQRPAFPFNVSSVMLP